MKRRGKRALSWILTGTMLLGMLPGLALPAKAATNLAGGFEGQDADVFSALGFDTSEIPEGYNEDTTENPYGRDIIPGNQVFELAVASSSGTDIYGRDSEFDPDDVDALPSGGGAMPNGMKLFAAAAGDFDGDGLAGGIAYVGVAGTSGGQSLYLYIYDGEEDTYGAAKTIGTGIDPANTAPNGQSYDLANYDYAWQNLLQIATGDYDGDGAAEIAVYVAENGNARVDIYKYQRTSQSGEKDWLNADQNWSRVWSHALSAGVVPNMVSLESGDFNRDGVDDLAIASGSLVFKYEIVGQITSSFTCVYSAPSTATVLWGGKSSMLQTFSALDLNTEEVGEQARVGLTFGDVDGDGVKDLIAAGQPVDDVNANTSRSITTYAYVDGVGMTVNSSAIYKVVDGEYQTIEGNTSWVSNNGFDDAYYSMPTMAANAAVMTPAGSSYTYLYVDSCLYRAMDGASCSSTMPWTSWMGTTPASTPQRIRMPGLTPPGTWTAM